MQCDQCLTGAVFSGAAVWIIYSTSGRKGFCPSVRTGVLLILSPCSVKSISLPRIGHSSLILTAGRRSQERGPSTL